MKTNLFSENQLFARIFALKTQYHKHLKSLVTAFLLLLSVFGWGQGTENFENIPPSSTSYVVRKWTGTDGVVWNATAARTDQTLTTKAICTNGSGTVTSPSYAGGMGTLSFKYVRAFTGTSARSIQVWVNGVQIGTTITVSGTSDVVATYSQAINVSGSVVLELRTAGAQIKIDDISWTAYSAGPAPSLAITPATTNLGTSCVGTPTTAVTYTITNSGSVAASGVSVASSGTHNTDFVVSALSSTTIAASGGTATYVVTFTPSGIGARNATVTVTSSTSGSNSPSTALTGTGAISVAQTVTTSAGGATALSEVSATLNGNVTALGTCPATTTKGFVYSQTAVDATPTNGEPGVTTTSLAVGATGNFSTGVVGLTPSTGYTYRAYVFNGTTYAYGGYSTFTTLGVPVVSNGSFTGTAGLAISTFNLSSLSTNTPSSYAITSGALPTGLSLNTSTGAITGTPTATGSFSIGFTASNSYGTSVTSGTVTITINPSQNSDIVTANGEATSILSLINNTSIANTSQGVQVWQFTIRDGGAGLNDADNLATILTALNITSPFGTADFNDIQTAALFDGSTKVSNDATFTKTGTQLQFTGLNVNVADNTSKTLSLRISLKCPLSTATVDSDNFGFGISNVNTTLSPSGSGRSVFPETVSSNATGINVVEVVATRLLFIAQPTSTAVNAAMGNVVVTAQDACGNRDLGFTGVVSLSSTGTMTGSPRTATAVAGVATFTGIIHTASGTGLTMNVTSTGLTSATSTTFDIANVTVLLPGDFAIVAVNTSAESSGSADELTFVAFKDILPGTQIFLTDNGYERVTAGLWGNTEGIVSLTRNGSTLPKGTFVTIHSINSGINSGTDFTITVCGVEDPNWTKDEITPGRFDLNKDDQVWFTQGGAWTNVSSGNHDTEYSGKVLYGWTDIPWETAPGYANSKGSTIVKGFKCFTTDVNNSVTGASRVTFNFDSSINTNDQLDWIALINNPLNWTAHTNNSDYFGSVAYGLYNSTSCATMTIATDVHTAGVWKGAKDTNWFNCSNWDTLKVPDQNTNVVIDTNAVREAVISASATDSDLYGDIAKTNHLTIQKNLWIDLINSADRLDIFGNLTIDNNAQLDMSGGTGALLNLYGNWTNNYGANGYLQGGTVAFKGSAQQVINGGDHTKPETFNHLILDANFDTKPGNDIITLGNLTINTGKNITINNSNNFIEVSGNISNSGNLTVESDGNLVQKLTSSLYTLPTAIKVKRNAYLKKMEYNYWGSPVVSQGLVAFSPNTLASRIFYYRESNDRFYAVNLATEPNFVLAKGYAFRTPDQGSNATTYNSHALFAGEFNGVPNNGNANITLKKTDATHGYNLVANPYPSNINLDNLWDDPANSNIETEAYFWTNNEFIPQQQGSTYNGNNYAIYNRVGGISAGYSADPSTVAFQNSNVPNGTVKVGQGFIARAKVDNAVLSFKNTYRNADAGYFFSVNKNASQKTKDRYWLQLISPSRIHNGILVGYINGGTNGSEKGFDTPQVEVGSDSFYSVLNGEKLAIQGREYPLVVEDIVPLGTQHYENGNYTIILKNKEGVFANGQAIYLHDKLNGTYTNLQETDFSFTAQTGATENRFEIVYEPNAVLGTNGHTKESLQVYRNGEDFMVKSGSPKIDSVEVYDASGKLFRKVKGGTVEVKIEASALPSGVYILKIIRNNEVISKKIIK